MNPSRYKVIQWATGNTGQRALREIIRDPRFELVGVLVYGDDKNGVDAGELCGEPPNGIKATTDRDAILALDADCVVYMPRATGSGITRAGLTRDELIADVVALAGSGKNIATTCTDLFAGGRRMGEQARGSILEACRKGNASIYASGSDPGFITEMVPLALLSVQRQVDFIEIEEFGDLSGRPSAHMVMEQMRFGKSLAEFDPDRRKNHLFGEYQPPLSVLAEIAGLDVDEWEGIGGVAAARHDTQIVAGMIKAGTAAAQRIIVSGKRAGKEVIRFIQYGFVSMDVDPDWGLRPSGWRLRVKGDASMNVDIEIPVEMNEFPLWVAGINANGLVNAIPYLCAAPLGILTAEELPHVLRKGPPNSAS